MSAEQQASFFEQAALAGRPHEYALPRGAHIEHCRSCGAQIVWGITPLGKPVPLAIATVQTRDGVQYAVSHFRDCEHADEWGQTKARSR